MVKIAFSHATIIHDNQSNKNNDGDLQMASNEINPLQNTEKKVRSHKNVQNQESNSDFLALQNAKKSARLQNNIRIIQTSFTSFFTCCCCFGGCCGNIKSPFHSSKHLTKSQNAKSWCQLAFLLPSSIITCCGCCFGFFGDYDVESILVESDV